MTTGSKNSQRILLVDDDDIFREVVASALAEGGYEVCQAGDGEIALDRLADTPDVGLVLSDIRMPKMDGVALLRRIRETSKIPVILATGFAEVMETQTAHSLGANGFLAKPFEIGELLGLVRSILEGADGGEELTDESFARIMLDDFVSGKTLKHNIFIRLGKNRFVKIAHEGVDLEIERVREYKKRGVTHLYLKKKDFREYLSRSLTISRRISADPTLDKKRRDRFLRQTGNLIVENVLVDGVDSFAVEAAREFFETSLASVTDDETLFRSLEVMNEHTDHLYAHSLGVAIYSIMIAREYGWRSAPTAHRIGLAGLFHDVGLKEIDRKIIDTPRANMNQAERAIYETHPIRSAAILTASGAIPEEVIQAVAQHHEDSNGQGYPNSTKGTALSPMARLITVADAFCEYAIRNPDYPKGMSAAEAVDKMEQFRSESLDPVYFGVLRGLIRSSSKKAG